MSIEELQQRRAQRNERRRMRRNGGVAPARPASPSPKPLADLVPAEFKRRLSRNAMQALVALGSASNIIYNRDHPHLNPFRLPDVPPSVLPPRKYQLAMDDALCETSRWAAGMWGQGQFLGGQFAEGLVFPGYPYLSQLALRPEYRIASETISDEMTRKWIRFRGVGTDPNEKDDGEEDDLDALENEVTRDLDKGKPKKGQGKFLKGGADTQDKTERIKELVDYMDHLGVKDAYYAAALGGGLFGRMHLFHEIDHNDGQSPKGLDELKSPLGDGRGEISLSKVGPKSTLTAIRPIEPLWCYPTTYNAVNPLQADFYNPQIWYLQGQQIHLTRLLRFIPRPVPDLLKPSYNFGGIALSQLMQPYVDIWLQVRTAIAKLIDSFSVMGLSTDMQTILQDPNLGAAGLLARINAFNKTRGNQGCFVINKDTEEFWNVSASLAGLHELQAQSQEHMCSVSRIPAVKFTGLQPTGLNASSEGEIKVFEDTIHGMQERDFRAPLTTTVYLCMLSLWGEVDEDIVFDFVPLRELSEKEEAELGKLKAERDDLLMNGCQAIGPREVRQRLSADPDSDFPDLDPDEEPELPEPQESVSGGKINLRGNESYGGGFGNQAAGGGAGGE